MTYVPRRHRSNRKPKDILVIALRNLWPGEEILCTSRTGENVRSRVDVFCQSRRDLRIEMISYGPVKKIRRVL